MIMTPIRERPTGIRALNQRLHDARCETLRLPEMEGALSEVFSQGSRDSSPE
ncbi:hypothetical protein [Microvirga sp. M2]|uniref:hypothetical protein n=1 Tax=Microvirga sp. M2 TaxID=3073270 RepID=UPI0039C081C0